MFFFAMHAAREEARHALASSEPKPMSLSSVSGVFENLRIVMHEPRSASGRMTALTREPSLQARVDERRRLVDAAAERRDDALDDGAHALVVGEARVR